MRRLFVLLLGGSSLLLSVPGTAQPTVDSLRHVLAAAPQADTIRVQRLNALASELLSTDQSTALTISQQAYALSQQLAYEHGATASLVTQSAIHRVRNNYDQARRLASQAHRRALRAHDNSVAAKALFQLSYLDMILGNPAQALQWGLQGLSLAEQAHDRPTQVRLRYTIGSIYYQLADYHAARPMLRAALREAQALQEQRLVILILNDLGNLYLAQENWLAALRYYQQALVLVRQAGDGKTETSLETNLAEVYRQQRNYAQAGAHARRARQLALTHADAYNLAQVNLLLARAYLPGQPDSAIALARHALNFSQQAGNNNMGSMATDVLTHAYAQQKNYAEAYRYQNMHVAYQDSLAGEEVQRKTAALRYGYDLEKKKARIALLEKTQQLEAQKAARQRQQLYALLCGVGGLVLVAGLLWRNVYLKQRANRHLNEKNAHIAQQRDELNQTLTQLKTTQYQLAQREKMALLGELTAGVAHEIQNPLNFVNNFSEVSSELLDELRQELSREHLLADGAGSIEGLLHDLSESQQKIQHHGQRADAIVRNMLEHSRHHAGTLQPTDLNALIEQTLRLAYSNQFADSAAGPITLTTSFDPQVGMINTMPQDLSRALLHLFNNAFYAVRQRQQSPDLPYQPAVTVSTHRLADEVEIRVRDNGSGIPTELTEKIFQPFFTTKPPGKGTGLGLSLSYDIISKGHGGTIRAESQEGEYAQFIVVLPASSAVATLEPAFGPNISTHQPA